MSERKQPRAESETSSGAAVVAPGEVEALAALQFIAEEAAYVSLGYTHCKNVLAAVRRLQARVDFLEGKKP